MEATSPVDRLLHITDVHFWRIAYNPLRLMNKRFLGNANVALRRSRHVHLEHAEAFADHAAATGIRTVVLGGDFTSTALDEEFALAADFLRGLRERGLNVHIVPGNHDCYTFEAVRARRFEQHLAEFIPPGGYPARVELPGGTPLILVSTVCPNVVTSRGRITDAEIADTLALVKGAPPGPVIVAGHYPLVHRTETWHSPPARQLRNARTFRAALGAAGRPVLYLAGHVHRFSWLDDPEYPDLRHLTTAAFLLHRPREATAGAFTEAAVCADGFSAWRHEYRDAWRREPLA